MNKNEIKKALYKEKPLATEVEVTTISDINGKDMDYSLFRAELSDGHVSLFSVPHSDMGENRFEKELPAQLLIRWLVY